MMICVVIKGPTYDEVYEQIKEAMQKADLIELRLDYFTHIDLKELKKLRSHCALPMIFTLRAKRQGGNWKGTEEERLAAIEKLLTLNPEYIDLESDLSDMILTHESKLILSYHNFVETTQDLDGLYQEMRKTPAHFYKIALMAQNSLDTLRLLAWQKKADRNVIAISMGAPGHLSRIMGCSAITYTALDHDRQTAPGQLSLQQLSLYNRSSTSLLYGLIGDPVEQSISDHTHNTLFKKLHINALYCKIPVKPSELSDCLHYAKLLSFQGLSVTMPLKEAILPFLDFIDPEAEAMGAVNTLLFKEGKITGYNTDGIGALNAIEKKCAVKNKKMVLIGSGGASKAIAYEAKKRGALVTILKRNQVLDIAYDILVNCTPVELPLSPDTLLPHTIVMDIKTKPKETLFLQEAKKKGCTPIYGYEMFIEQALGQFALWFEEIDLSKCRTILQEIIPEGLTCD